MPAPLMNSNGWEDVVIGGQLFANQTRRRDVSEHDRITCVEEHLEDIQAGNQREHVRYDTIGLYIPTCS